MDYLISIKKSDALKIQNLLSMKYILFVDIQKRRRKKGNSSIVHK